MRDVSQVTGPVLKAFAAAFALATGLSAPAQAQNRAGEFDHYVLALSWIPAYCAQDGDARQDERCESGARVGWRVHGLWPQHAGGDWPEYCNTNHRNPSRQDTAAEADIFGSGGSAWHQWNKHGRCTGLSAQQYYALTREAFARFDLPEVFEQIDRRLSIAPQVVEDAFIDANPELNADMMTTSCRSNALTEVRICLTSDLEPRACDRAQRSCNARQAELLPLR